MSVYKWEKLYQYTLIHQVTPESYQGLKHCESQFLLHLSDKLWEVWERVASGKDMLNVNEKEKADLLRPDHLTNPMLNHKLQDILDDEKSDMNTRRQLLKIIRIVRHILNEGMPVKLLMELGVFIRNEGHRVDYITLQKWVDKLHLSPMCQLEGELLIQLFGFDKEEIPFMGDKEEKDIVKIARELINFSRLEDYYFSQENGNIFVHNSNSAAMFTHMRHSAHYFRYYPSEILTNFFASFAHSLSHVEE